MLHPAALLLAALAGGGEVRDAVTRAPLAGVLVHVVGTADSIRTGADGRWSLATASTGARVRFTRAGYTPLELTLAASDADVALSPVARTLEGTTITAIRAGDAAPVTRSAVTKADIDRRWFGQEMPLFLTATPSTTAYNEGGAYAGYSYIRLRGIDQTRLNITLDGVPLNDPEDQVLYFSNVPDFGNSMQSVDVQRGVGTSSNGTAAYGGSLNFESIGLASAPRGGELQVTRGSFDTWRGSLEGATGLRPDGFAAYGRVSGLETANYRYHAGNTSGSAFTSAGWFGARSSAKLLAFVGRSDSQLAYYAVSDSALRVDPRQNPLSTAEKDNFSQHLVALSGTHLVGDAGSVAVTAYRVGAGGDYNVRFDPTTVWNYGLEHAVHGVLASGSFRLGRLALDAGTHANTYARDHYAADVTDLSNRFYTNTGHKQELSGFGKARWQAGSVALFGDLQLRLAHFRYEPDRNADISERAITWRFANPRGGVTWQASRALALYASYGRTGREPARNDMFAGFDNVDTSNVDFVGPLSRVRPEYVNDAEAGATLRGRSAMLRANVYDMRFHDEIAAIGQLSYIGLPLRKNVPRSYRRGVELDGSWTPVAGLTATANATISRNRIAEYTDDASGETFRDVEPLLTPTVLANQSLAWRLRPSLALTLGGRYVGRSFLANTGDRRFMTPAFWMTDAGATFTVARQELLVQVNNLLDERRAYTSGYTDGTSSYYYVSAPRNVMVTARVRF